MKNPKIIFIVVCLLAILYFFCQIITYKSLSGIYHLVNYEDAFSFPSHPDSITINTDGSFKSLMYGEGKLELRYSLGITRIYLNTNLPSDVLGHTVVKRTLNGDIKIVMSADEDIYYKKVKH
jgi:hypothetical protein